MLHGVSHKNQRIVLTHVIYFTLLGTLRNKVQLHALFKIYGTYDIFLIGKKTARKES